MPYLPMSSHLGFGFTRGILGEVGVQPFQSIAGDGEGRESMGCYEDMCGETLILCKSP